MRDITVDEKIAGKRVDIALLELLNSGDVPQIAEAVSRSMLQKAMKNGGVIVNNKPVKASYRLELDDLLRIDIEQLVQFLNELYEGRVNLDRIDPESGDLDIVAETADYIVINKQAGVVVHPGVGNSGGTIANFVKGYLMQKGEYDNSIERAGLVHRLDKGVSGLMVIAKNRAMQQSLKKQFEDHSVIKIYKAKVERFRASQFSNDINQALDERGADAIDWKSALGGDIEMQDDALIIRVEGYIARDKQNRKRMSFSPLPSNGARKAISYIRPADNDIFYIRIVTGRMHQIRATLHYLGYRIVGDDLYGIAGDRIELYSVYLSFKNMTDELVSFAL